MRKLVNIGVLISIVISIFSLLSIIAFASPSVNFTSPTTENDTYTPYSNVYANVSIQEDNLKNLTWYFNNTYYDIYSDSLILMFNFENNSNLIESKSNIADLSVSQNNATSYVCVYGGSCPSHDLIYTSGRHGKAANFNGSSYIDPPVNLPLNGTVSMWIKPKYNMIDGLTYQEGLVVSSTGTSLPNFIMRWYDDSSILYFYMYDTGWKFVPSQTVNWYNDTWYHIVGTWNDTNMTLYINNNMEGHKGKTKTTRLNDITIGRSIYGTTFYYFNGTIDSFKLYNRTLSADEIKLLYTTELNRINMTHWDLKLEHLTDEPWGNMSYNYSVEACNQTQGFCNDTKTNRVTFLGIPPINTYQHPSPLNNTCGGNETIIINTTIEELNLRNFTYKWNNTEVQFHYDNLVLWYEFENNTIMGESYSNADSKIVDLSRAGNNGTTINGSGSNLTSRGFGKAINLTLDNMYVEVNNSINTTIRVKRNITVSAWARANSWEILGPGGGGVLISTADDLTTNGFSLEIGFNEPLCANARFYVGTQDGWKIAPSAGQCLSGNKWYHIAGTFNGTNISVYIDGEFKNSTNTGDWNITYNNLPVRIGKLGSGTQNFSGSIDSVMIFNTTLNASEIKLLYQMQLYKYNNTHYDLYINQTNASYLNYTATITTNDYAEHTTATPRLACNSLLCYAEANCTTANDHHCLNSLCVDLSGNRKFRIRNSSNHNQAFFDAAGNLILKSTLATDQGGTCTASTGSSFTVKDAAGSIISWINSTGHMCIGGALTENAGADLGCSDAFIIKDNQSNDKVCIDKATGNMQLSGFVSQSGVP
ncbi:MAG: LamG domain-containing protein [Candidatus Woesearchaeota archaeon]